MTLVEPDPLNIYLTTTTSFSAGCHRISSYQPIDSGLTRVSEAFYTLTASIQDVRVDHRRLHVVAP